MENDLTARSCSQLVKYGSLINGLCLKHNIWNCHSSAVVQKLSPGGLLRWLDVSYQGLFPRQPGLQFHGTSVEINLFLSCFTDVRLLT